MEQKVINDWNTPEIQKAYKELERLSLDPEFRLEYEYEYKRLTDLSWRYASAYKKGEDKEKALSKEREKKAQARIAASLLNEGMDKSKIALIIGISLDELQNLLDYDPA